MASDTEPSLDTTANTEPSATSESLDSATAGDNGTNAAEERDEQDQPDGQMPDASSLLAMAAMHMETTPLIQVLVSVFHAHAWRSMGLVADHSGDIRKDMASAQTAIDCLAFMLEKIEGTLEDAEKRDIQRRLMDLRMNYIAKLREG